MYIYALTQEMLPVVHYFFLQCHSINTIPVWKNVQNCNYVIKVTSRTKYLILVNLASSEHSALMHWATVCVRIPLQRFSFGARR